MMSVGYTLTGDELTVLQKRGTSHIAFGITEECPLRCAHCMVSKATAGRRGRGMTIERAKQYAAQFECLRSLGVERISFSGGEPLLAPAQLRVLSQAAAAAGITSTVVTSGHWATDERVAERVFRSLPEIQTWHVSADRFHQEFVPQTNVRLAVEAALRAGRDVLVRMTSPVPPTASDQKLYDEIQGWLPNNVEVLVQPLRHLGRALQLPNPGHQARSKMMPCLTGGMMLRPDGLVSPCCACLVAQTEGLPFDLDSPELVGVPRVYQQWRANTLLRLIRSIGFSPVVDWISEQSPEHPILRSAPADSCELCLALWRIPGAAATVRRRCLEPTVRRKVDELYEAVFG